MVQVDCVVRSGERHASNSGYAMLEAHPQMALHAHEKIAREVRTEEAGPLVEEGLSLHGVASLG